MVLRELVTVLGFKADDKALNHYEKEMQALKKTMLAIVGTATAVGAALFGVSKSAAKAGDELDKTLRLVGLTAKQFQLLRGAGQLQGLEPEEFSKSLQFFNQLVGMARQGMQTSLKPFQTLGISLRDAQGNLKNTYDLLLDTADAFTRLHHTADKTIVSKEAFGGMKMINFLQGGSAGIKQLMTEFSKYAYILDDKAIKASAKFQDQLFLLGTSLTGIKNEVGEALIPQINILVKKMLDWFEVNKKLVAQDITVFLQALTKVFQWLAIALDTVIGAVNGVVDIFKVFLATLTPFEKRIAKITVLVGLLAAGFSAIPLTIASIILILDDINVYLHGGDSVIGRLIKKFPTVFALLKSSLHEVKAVIHSTIIVPLEVIYFLLKKIYSLAEDLGGFTKILTTVGDTLGKVSVGLPLASMSKGMLPATPGQQAKHYNVQNTIHMAVPAGTAFAQQDFLKKTAKDTFDAVFSEELNKTLIHFQRLEQ